MSHLPRTATSSSGRGTRARWYTPHRLSISVMLALLAFGCRPAEKSPPKPADEAKGVKALVLESLRIQREQSQNLAYSETTTFEGKQKRFDWVLASFPSGDWSVQTTLPTRDTGPEKHLYIRRGPKRFFGKVEPNLDWAAVIEDHSRAGRFWHSPTASRWFPVDAVRVDERLLRWAELDCESGDDLVALTVPANPSVQDALGDARATIDGLFGYRFEFTKIADAYVLSRCDILQVTRHMSGEASEGVECLDDWRRDIAGYEVGRSYSRLWSDFRRVGSHTLAMKWEYRFPEGTTTGEVHAETVRQLSAEELETRLALAVPEEWTGRGILRDRKTGKVLHRAE